MVLTPRRLFVALGVLAALAIVAFRTDSLLRERASLITEHQTQAETTANALATFVARQYDTSDRALTDIVAHLRDHPLGGDDLHAYLRQKAEETSQNDYIVILDAQGRVLESSEEGAAKSVSYGGPNFQAQQMAAGRRVLPLMRSKLTGAVISSVVTPLTDAAGAFVGVAGVSARVDTVQPTNKRKPDNLLVTLWGNDGKFLAANFTDFDADGQVIAPPKPSGVGLPGAPRQKDVGAIASAASVPGWPIMAASSFDKTGALSKWRRDVRENLVLLLLVIAALAVLVWFGLRTADREELTKTELIAAIAERDLLVKEVHHRVKNSLVMTASLIQLQERQFTDPAVRDAFESMRSRLTSIGLVHEALYSGSSLEEVELGSYLSRLIQDVAAAHGAAQRGITVSTDLATMHLPPTQTTPVGLIVAEVLTNAFKHAFPDGAFGTISVRTELLPTDELLVEVRDDGRGHGAVKAGGGGLGTRLINALTTQLGGVHTIANDGGAAFRLTFPRQRQ